MPSGHTPPGKARSFPTPLAACTRCFDRCTVTKPEFSWMGSGRGLGMDLAETMKNIVAKSMQTEMGSPGGGSGYPGSASGAGYLSENMYVLLQFYLENKRWNPDMQVLQERSNLKDGSMLANSAYYQMMASRVALDAEGKLILRENGKRILPYEHFANAVMLKHMGEPGMYRMHLGVEGTIRAVMDSYTIGRECFGMEKEFIIEVVQNCPNSTCRYYKNQLELTQKMGHMAPTYIQGNEAIASLPCNEAIASLLRSNYQLNQDLQAALSGPAPNTHMGAPSNDMNNLRDGGNQINLQQRPLSRPSLNIPHRPSTQEKKPNVKQHYESLVSPIPMNDHKSTDFLRSNIDNLEGLSGLGLGNLQSLGNANKDLLALHNGAWTVDNEKSSRSTGSNTEGGQEKVVRAFAEVMKNMARIKTCVRPAMCKPYGKQSETLQKTLVDTIQLVQSLRSFLPPPHIPVSSWKNEDKHRLDHNIAAYLPTLKAGGLEDMCEQRKLD